MQVLEEEKTKLDAFCEQSLKNVSSFCYYFQFIIKNKQIINMYKLKLALIHYYIITYICNEIY